MVIGNIYVNWVNVLDGSYKAAGAPTLEVVLSMTRNHPMFTQQSSIFVFFIFQSLQSHSIIHLTSLQLLTSKLCGHGQMLHIAIVNPQRGTTQSERPTTRGREIAVTQSVNIARWPLDGPKSQKGAGRYVLNFMPMIPKQKHKSKVDTAEDNVETPTSWQRHSSHFLQKPRVVHFQTPERWSAGELLTTRDGGWLWDGDIYLSIRSSDRLFKRRQVVFCASQVRQESSSSDTIRGAWLNLLYGCQQRLDHCLADWCRILWWLNNEPAIRTNHQGWSLRYPQFICPSSRLTG